MFSYQLRVRYQETDQMGVVYHANYLNWLEIGRTEWVRALGYSYSRLEEYGLLLPVVEAELKYRQPAKYDDIVEVAVDLIECSHVKLAFEYIVTRVEDKAELVRGKTKHVWVNRSWKPVRIDKQLPELYERILSLRKERTF